MSQVSISFLLNLCGTLGYSCKSVFAKFAFNMKIIFLSIEINKPNWIDSTKRIKITV